MNVEKVDHRTTQITLENIGDDLLIGKSLWSQAKEEIKLLVFYLTRDNKDKADNSIIGIRKIIQLIKELGYESIANELNESLEQVVVGGGVKNE